jgi:hypothetical protein
MCFFCNFSVRGLGGMGDGESVFCLDMADCSLVTNGDVDYALMFMFYKRISNEDLMFTTGYPG